MIRLFLSVTFATALIGSVAFGQTSTSTTTTATDKHGTTDTTTTTTTEGAGIVTEYTPGQALILKTEAAEPVHYTFGKTVTYVTSDGRVIEASSIRKDSKVRVHYLREGDSMVVDKVIVTEARY
jgi:hypothetical protein